MKEQSKTVAALNQAFKKDPNAVHSLVCHRVPCNRELADDEFVQVHQVCVLPGEHFQVGAVGLINAILTANGLPLVGVVWEDSEGDGPNRILGFCDAEFPH